MHQMFRRVWLCTIVLTLVASTWGWAGPLIFMVDDLGGGLFQYNFTLTNPFSVPLSGLNIFNANSVFGLDDFSVIGAPENIGGNPLADWSFFAPSPPFVDELNYFSLHPAADVPIGGSLGGFFFQSTTAPSTLPAEGLVLFRDYDLIDASGRQIPEPSIFLLMAIGLLVLFYSDWRKRKLHGSTTS
jgi:hypothetical protein